MADRSVSVRLRLINAEYRRGMAEATGDTTKFAAAAKGAFSGLGDQLKQVGGTMTRNVTVPLTALGAGALKLGNDFETAFAHMVGLANVPAAEIDGLKQSVLELAHETARSPQELAEGLYYIRSSGISAAKSLDVLKIAGQAAAAGLGSTQDIAKAVGFAINAYGENNLSAAKATDILVGTIREGTIEAGELAPVMGTLIPTASALGISFETVAGTMAVMSKNGADASDSATGLSAVMSTLLGTSAAGTQLLEEHGLSLKQLRDIAAGPDGLVGVFRTLSTAFQGNDEALATVIPNIRALRTFMNVLSQDAAGVDRTLKAVTNSAGATASAFDAVEKTDAFKQKQAITDVKVALVELGAAIAPAAAGLAGLGTGLLHGFASLPGPVKELALAFVVLLAVVGPMASIAGRIGANWELLTGVASKLAGVVGSLRLYFQTAAQFGVSFGAALGGLAVEAAGAAVSMLAIVGPIVAIAKLTSVLVGKWQDHQRAMRENTEEIRKFTTALVEGADRAQASSKIILDALNPQAADGKYATLIDQMRTVGVVAGDVAKAVAGGAQDIDDLKTRILGASAAEIDAMRNVKLANTGDEVAKQTARELDLLIARYQQAQLAYEAFIRARGSSGEARIFTPGSEANISAAEAALADLSKESELAGWKLGDLGSAFENTGNDAIMASSHLAGFLAFLDDIYGASFQVIDAHNAWSNSLEDVTAAASSTGGATKDLTSEQRSLEKATKDVTKAQQGLADAEAALAEARKGPTDREKHDAGLGVREANLGLKEAQQAVVDAQKKVTEEQKKGKDGDVKGARLALEAASIRLVRAQDAVTDAQAAQNDVLTSGEETSKKVKAAVDDVTAAQERLADAQQSEADAEKTLAGTNGGPVADKHRAIKGAIDQSVTAGDNWIKKLIEQKAPAADIVAATDDQREAVQKLIDTYGDPDGKLKKYLNYLLLIATLEGKPLPSWADPVGVALAAADALPSTRGASAPLPGRAAGGPVMAGVSYLVGENRRPEIFTPGASGYVTPDTHLTAASRYSAPQAMPMIRFELPTYIDADKVGTAIGVASWSNGGYNIKIYNS